FFQAEDGIRDFHVTGVQTCALPILKFQYNKTSLQSLGKQLKVRERALPTLKNKESALRSEVKRAKDRAAALEQELEQELGRYDEIGRASCRERVWVAGIAR